MDGPVLILFAKTPLPGKVKTRLQPRLTPEDAARVAALLIDLTVRRVSEHWPGEVVLYAWPSTDHPFFRSLGTELNIAVRTQCEGDLGSKMLGALSDFGDRPAAVMGCDVPQCEGAILRYAARLLNRGKNAIGPSRDGGYYLIGLQSPAPSLFAHIPWGTGEVLTRTLEQAARIEVAFKTLPALTDIDVFDDLLSIQSEFPALADGLRRLNVPDI